MIETRQRLEQEKGKLAQVQSDLEQVRVQMARALVQADLVEQAGTLIRTVAQETQNQLSWFINDMVSAAVEAIFPEDDYRFALEFVTRRGVTEADLYLTDSKGNRIKPKDSEGGGLVNVVAFALRVALWSLTKSSRPVFILDEPFHFLHSREAHAKVAELLSTLSRELGVQIVMVTGEDESEEIVGGADRVFRVTKGEVKQE